MYGSNMQKTFNSIGVHTFKVPSRSSSQSNSGGSGSNQSASSKNDDGGIERDNAWLEAHNVRRKKYHLQWGKSYVPLKWSPMLASQAKQWANHLVTKCDVPLSQISNVEPPVADHDPNTPYGENMAANFGNGDNGELKSPDQILNRFVEMEMDDGYPNNYHMTQVHCAGVVLSCFLLLQLTSMLLILRCYGGLRSMLVAPTPSGLLKGLKGGIVGFRCAAMRRQVTALLDLIGTPMAALTGKQPC
jgi:hypothetical protein